MNKFIINLGLVVAGIATVFSGMLIQINFHMGNHGNIDINDRVLGINYHSWSGIHKISIVVLSLLMVYHVYQHWKWYKTVISKRLFSKNQQVLVLSLLFVLVAFTGIVPWLIDLLEGNKMIRKLLIEIHDKLTLILSVYFILHIAKRLKWFFITFEKIQKKKQSNQS